ncbi:MAG TPA: DUF6526 family protein [Blastocatellia bacterium]|nr:DUF6526 family protein [Blastocatellia bacterium]
MADTTQSYANHVRWHPIYHFFLSPIMVLNLIWSVVRVIRFPGWDNAELALLGVGLAVMALLVRTNPLRVQDRVIRLEEQLRYQRVLPAELAERAGALPVSKIAALRFAPDEELPGLVRQVLDGKLAKSDEIKRAIKNWRGDYFRV